MSQAFRLFSFFLLLAVLFIAACAGIQRNPTQQAIVALDTSTCVATDILPGVPNLVDHLASNATPTAERTILGLISGISGVSKGVACYLRAQASMKTQETQCVSPEMARGLQPGERLCAVGELRVIEESMLIYNRAKCAGSCRQEQILAKWLVAAEKKGLVAPLTH